MTEENDFIYTLSFTGKLDSPYDPLPPECLHVRVHASSPLLEKVQKTVKTECLPEAKKLPLISTAQDTVLLLKDVQLRYAKAAEYWQKAAALLPEGREEGSGQNI